MAVGSTGARLGVAFGFHQDGPGYSAAVGLVLVVYVNRVESTLVAGTVEVDVVGSVAGAVEVGTPKSDPPSEVWPSSWSAGLSSSSPGNSSKKFPKNLSERPWRRLSGCTEPSSPNQCPVTSVQVSLIFERRNFHLRVTFYTLEYSPCRRQGIRVANHLLVALKFSTLTQCTRKNTKKNFVSLL